MHQIEVLGDKLVPLFRFEDDEDDPPEHYGGDRYLLQCLCNIMGDLLDSRRRESSRYPEGCLVFKDVIERHGNEEDRKSKSRCFINDDGNKKATESFSTPVEDVEDEDVEIVEDTVQSLESLLGAMSFSRALFFT